MKIPRPHAIARATMALASFLLASSSPAKPPSKNASTPAASPAPTIAATNPDTDPLARWLLSQDGQRNAITLPLSQVVFAATGKRVVPFDPANPADAAFLHQFSAMMDRVLPRINRPDSPAHSAAGLGETDEVAARVEDEIRAVTRDSTAFSSPAVADGVFRSRGYPACRLVDASSGKAYYLAVTLYPSGKREEATRITSDSRAFRFDPTEAGGVIAADGCCLLVGVEHSGKMGGEIAFLNWDVVDVANLPIHAAITFDADGNDVYHPGAVLTDGRKGSD